MKSLKSDLASAGGNDDRKGRLFLLLLLFLPCFFIHNTPDNDAWFILASGRYVLQHGIPYIEPLTLHQNMQFVMQQWLTAVVFWGVYSKLGVVGLIALVFVVFVCVIAVIYQLARFLSNGNFVATFIASFLAAVCLTPWMTTRPIIFTLLFLILELYALERYIASAKAVWLIPLPFLSALMINFHAAMWLVQFVFLLPYFIDSFRFKLLRIEGQGYAKKPLILTVVLMFAAGFTSPYGFQSMTYLFRSYGYTEFGVINEMMPANINEISGIFIFGTFLILGAIYFLHQKGTTRLRYMLLALGTAVMALSSIRSFALFVLCSFFPLAYYLREIRMPQNKIKSVRKTRLLRAVLIVLVVLELGYVFYNKYTKLIETGTGPDVAEAVQYLKEHASTDGMVLYTGYDDGGYAEFMGFRPYLDPRAEAFVLRNNHTYDIMKEYVLMESGSLYYKEVLDKYQFTHLIVPRYDILFTYLSYDSDYQKIYEDDTHAIYVHS